MKNPVKVFAVPALLFLAAATVCGQSSPPPASPSGALPKLAIVDIRAALLSTAEGKQMAAEIQSQFSAKQAELDNMRKNLEDIQTRLRNGERTLSDEERIRLERQGQRMQQQLQRKQEEYQQDFNDAQQDAIDKLGRKMGEVISRYARENGYLMIMDAQVCNIYCSNQLDVTQDIIRLYDQANPVKGAATAPARPGTTRPGATSPAKPTKP
ncbi:MAG TPA: OmpH family outer membrane protein [Candidatus Acidoferrales bacterium]|nr:OmpH family outer membrane protein [Candidatus Acidoferrales bacterium]